MTDPGDPFAEADDSARSHAEQVSALYHELFEMDPAERARILDERDLAPEVVNELLGLFDQTMAGAPHGGLADGSGGEQQRATQASGPGPRKEFGKYRLLQELGRGGQGVVFLAEDARLRRKVALKMLSGSALQSEDVRTRFHREAETASRLNHPGICAVHEVGEEDGIPYIAMQYVRGETLEQAVASARAGLPTGASRAATTVAGASQSWEGVRQLLEMFANVALALHEAHEAGLIHRDIKPANIMVERSGQPVILDFGLARDLDSNHGHTLTVSGQLMGTPAYMPPEQMQGDRGAVDRRSDVYSLTTTLYECLTLHRPFEADSLDRLFDQIRTSNPVNPRSLNPLITRDLAAVLEVGMEREPQRRYASAAALAEDLIRVASHEAVQARAAGLLRRVQKWARVHPVRAVALGAAVLMIVATVSAIVWSAIDRARAIRGHLVAAESHLAATEYDLARESVAKALERDPLNGPSLLLRARINVVEQDQRRATDLEAAAGLREDARAQLQAAIEAAASFETMQAALVSDQERVLGAYSTPAENAAFHHRTKQSEALARRARQLRDAVLDTVAQAEKLEARWGEPDPENDRIRADFYMSAWRAATAAGEDASLLRERVEAVDTEGRYRAELVGLRQVRFSQHLPDTGVANANPPELAGGGPRVHMFRFEPYDRVRTESPVTPRLVPVACVGEDTQTIDDSYLPGDPGLEILGVAADSPAARVGLEPGDLVVSIDGLPCASGFFVAGDGTGRGDLVGRRILSINGVEIDSYFDLGQGLQQRADHDGALDACRFAGDDTTSELDARALSWIEVTELLENGLPDAPSGPRSLTALHEGTRRTLELQPGESAGLSCRPTHYPLICGPQNRIDPDAELAARPGSYLLLVRAPGCATARVPFSVRRSAANAAEPVEVEIPRMAAGTVPPGFAWIPAGPFEFSGASTGEGEDGDALPELPDFFMAIHEVTNEEWYEFVNDPAIRARIDASENRELLPREASGLRTRQREDGSYGPFRARPGRPLLRNPVWGVSHSDAHAFVEWKNARARQRGEPWIYSLPSGEQWEKAARGVDGRIYPWGDVFDPSLTFSRYNRPGWVIDEPAGGEPADESVYGIRDLCGSRQEWTDEHAGGSGIETEYVLRGGSWFYSPPATFRCDVRHEANARATTGSTGVRLVARFARETDD